MEKVTIKSLLLLVFFIMLSVSIQAQSKEEIKKQKRELAYFNKVMGSDKDKTCEKYIKLIESENLLYRIAVEHKRNRISKFAACQIENEKLFYEIVRIYLQRSVTIDRELLDRIQNEDFLCEVAFELRDLSGYIAERINNQNLLYKIAEHFILTTPNKTTESPILRQIIARITNQELLFKLISYFKTNKQMCLVVLSKISDTEILKKIFNESRSFYYMETIQTETLEKIDDQTFLYEVVLNNLSSMSRKVLAKINDQTLLYNLALNAENSDIKRLAYLSLNEEMLQKIVWENDKKTDYINFINKFPDSKFTELAKERIAWHDVVDAKIEWECPKSLKSNRGRYEWTVVFLETGGYSGYTATIVQSYVMSPNGDIWSSNKYGSREVSNGRSITVPKKGSARYSHWISSSEQWNGGTYYLVWRVEDERGNTSFAKQTIHLEK